MQKELMLFHDALLGRLKQESGVLGGWYFGSLAHGTADEYSNIDLVLLTAAEQFASLNERLPELIRGAGGKLLLQWAEDFNSEEITNYDCLVEFQGELFQYDLFF